MATTTQNLGLIEPAGTDHALVANINTNSEKIDAEAGKARSNFALVQNGDTATQAISQGQLVVWKGALKKATTNIASGATLSSSNLTDDSIAAEIASLNGNLANLHFLPVTITDTIPVGEVLSPGVALSTITGGVITEASQIKGFSMFNSTSSYLEYMQYLNKIVLAIRTAAPRDMQISVKAVIMY